MRKATANAVNAFIADRKHGGSNTTVAVEDGVTKMFLFGNLIAKKENGKTFITNCGYETPTTKERLNALPGVNIQQKDFVWYLNGKEWDGKWTEI